MDLGRNEPARALSRDCHEVLLAVGMLLEACFDCLAFREPAADDRPLTQRAFG